LAGPGPHHTLIKPFPWTMCNEICFKNERMLASCIHCFSFPEVIGRGWMYESCGRCSPTPCGQSCDAMVMGHGFHFCQGLNFISRIFTAFHQGSVVCFLFCKFQHV
jgi:hypothetical protein